MNEVVGWVRSGNVRNLVQHIAAYAGGQWDGADQDALEGVLPGTDAEARHGWFDYPIAGGPSLLMHLAVDVGTDVVRVRVESDFDSVLTARLETLIDIL